LRGGTTKNNPKTTVEKEYRRDLEDGMGSQSFPDGSVLFSLSFTRDIENTGKLWQPQGHRPAKQKKQWEGIQEGTTYFIVRQSVEGPGDPCQCTRRGQNMDFRNGRKDLWGDVDIKTGKLIKNFFRSPRREIRAQNGQFRARYVLSHHGKAGPCNQLN